MNTFTYNNESKMKRNILIKLFSLLAFLQAGLASCDYIHDDIDPCPHYLRFTYTYNMKFADAFAHEMVNQSVNKQVELYIYGEDGKFISSRTISGSELETNHIRLDLQPGTYRLLAWAGLNDTHYTWSAPSAGASIADWQMTVKDGSTVNVVDHELLGLFQGTMTLVIPEGGETDTEFPLVKNTNKLRVVLIDANTGTGIDAGNFSVKATTSNRDLDYRNEPVSDTAVTWLPYYKGTEQVNSSDGKAAYSAACYELNTLRLLDGTRTALQLSHNGEAAPFLDVDLTDFLALTKMESHDIGKQEYLDRQDEYTILVYLDLAGGKAHYLEIIVNDWVIRLNDINFGK